jgi:hypothetical protein
MRERGRIPRKKTLEIKEGRRGVSCEKEKRKKERAARLATSDELPAHLATQERRERGKSKICCSSYGL